MQYFPISKRFVPFHVSLDEKFVSLLNVECFDHEVILYGEASSQWFNAWRLSCHDVEMPHFRVNANDKNAADFLGNYYSRCLLCLVQCTEAGFNGVLQAYRDNSLATRRFFTQS